MSRLNLLWGKKSLVTVFSVAFMVFGLGCISWAIFNIWSQSNYTVAVTPSHVLKHVSVPNKVLYPVYPVDGDNIGSLSIPALKQKFPIVQGTGVNELKKGIGHFLQSVLPGEKDNCVLSAHRDTVFSKIGNLKIGDHLIVQTSAGIFTYEVNGTRIVHEDDKTVIVPTANAVLTLTTCYPFKFIGDAPDRYIVSATLIKSN